MMARRTSSSSAPPFAACGLQEKLARLVAEFPHLAPYFDGQFDSIYALARRDRAAAAEAVKKQRGAA